ncbi:hypothetical protein HY993_04875 [Candidatus Micrarchaeota archaeon]|nr:hypothetical protein [Candidatus Micrarchaeota archaeon]
MVCLITRGQAFETMMLVISVIVALAILAVLMNIIGGIDLGGTSNPETAIRDGLREVQSKGYGLTAPKKINLKKDTIILKKTVIGTTPIAETELSFFCDGATICDASKGPIKVADYAGSGAGASSVSISGNVEVNMVACANEEKTSNPKYCVVLARTSADATTSCKTACTIT